MDLVMLTGYLEKEPKLTVVRMDKASVYMVKFILVVGQEYIECVCFGNAAQDLQGYLSKEITVIGMLRNFRFRDAHATLHRTNIVVAADISEVEDGRSYRVAGEEIFEIKDSRQIAALAALKGFEEADDMFRTVCRAGYLCIDENDYYRFAGIRSEK